MHAFLKYFCVSLLATSADYVTVLALLAWGLAYQLSLLVGVIVGGCIAFFLQTFWVFRTSSNPFSLGRMASSFSGPCLVYGIRWVLMYCWYAANMSAQWEYLALLCVYGISFCTNFLFQKFFYTRF